MITLNQLREARREKDTDLQKKDREIGDHKNKMYLGQRSSGRYHIAQSQADREHLQGLIKQRQKLQKNAEWDKKEAEKKKKDDEEFHKRQLKLPLGEDILAEYFNKSKKVFKPLGDLPKMQPVEKNTKKIFKPLKPKTPPKENGPKKVSLKQAQNNVARGIGAALKKDLKKPAAPKKPEVPKTHDDEVGDDAAKGIVAAFQKSRKGKVSTEKAGNNAAKGIAAEVKKQYTKEENLHELSDTVLKNYYNKANSSALRSAKVLAYDKRASDKGKDVYRKKLSKRLKGINQVKNKMRDNNG